MTTIAAQDLRIGDRIGTAGWSIETLIVRPRQSREAPGVVMATGANSRGERFALNCKPHRPVQVRR